MEKRYVGQDARARQCRRTDPKCSFQVQNEDVKKKTRKMLRKIIEITQSLNVQSDDVFITVLLKWNPDTPTDYEPSGFMPAKYTFNLHKSDKNDVRVGSVRTNFHAVAAKIRYVMSVGTLLRNLK